MKTAKLISVILKNPVSILKKGIIAQKETYYKDALRAAYGIDQLPTVDLLDLFPDFDESLSAYSFLEGTSLITDMMLLKKLARMYPACNYLEIGSWRGESLMNISEVAKSCTTINLPHDEMLAMGVSKDIIALHSIFSKEAKNITEVFHNSHTLDFKSLGQKYDLAFIDGDHSYEGVRNDTKKTFEVRKDETSVIVWHDYAFSPETVRHSVFKGILDGIPADKHKNLYHVSNTMCAIYIENKTFPTYKVKFPSTPTKRFSVQMQTHKL